MKIKISLILMISLFFIHSGHCQDEKVTVDKRIRPFVAYEFGEAAFNRFQSLSGEVGVRFGNDHMLRMTHMNVNLTEGHLSSGFAGAVDGEGVEGKFFGFEAFYDFPVLLKGLYISPSLGYYKNEYNHTVLDENLKNNSATIGLGISYREVNLFGLKGLYYMISIPMRTPFNRLEETSLGDATIKRNTFDNNIWLFVGYEF